MEIKINKEIRNYTESMFFGLSMRQFFFAVIGVGFAVLTYFMLRSNLGTERCRGSVCSPPRRSWRWDSSPTTV